MKSALIGVASLAIAAIAAPAAAQPVVSNPGWCAQFYPDANCQNLGLGNPYTGDYQARQGWGAYRGSYAQMGPRVHGKHWRHRYHRHHR